MPLLGKEPDIFPDELFTLALEPFPWFVAHVRSRQEKVMARYLRQRFIPYYLPVVEQKKKRSGRTFTSFLPLFPGYLFARGGSKEREASWRSDVAVNLITVTDQRLLAAQLEELRSLQL